MKHEDRREVWWKRWKRPPGYIHMALLDVLDPLIDIVGELLPDADAQLPL
jgi:hypothetical protein